MFKVNQDKQENETENKDKNEGFVDENGKALSAADTKIKDEPNPNDVDLNAKVEYNDAHLENIEKARQAFLKVVRKQNIIKWIVALLAIGLLIFAWLYFLANDKFKNIPSMRYGCGIGLSIVSIAIIVAYYIVIKRFNDKRMNEYLKVYYGDTNAYVFGDKEYIDVHGDIAGKIDNDEFNKSQLYKDVSTLGSRNVITLKVKDKNIKICDCAAQKSTVKKLEPLFIGKYILADNKYNNNEPIYIYLTGNSRALPPNNLDAIPKVMHTRKMIIYTKNKNYEKTVNANVRALISSIITNNILVDCSIAIHKGYTCFAMGYDDCLMVLPLNDKFNSIPLNRYKKDMGIVINIIEKLN